MIKMSKPFKSGEPMGSLVVHTPEEAVVAQRSSDGSCWLAEVRTGTAVRAMSRKGWKAAASSGESKPKSAAVKTPSSSPKKQNSSSRVSLDVLDLSVPKLEEAIASGKYDSDLSELLKAEEAGKTRKTAVMAIKSRMESL